MATGPTLTETARFGGIDFAALSQMIQGVAAARGLDTAPTDAGGLICQTPLGSFAFTPEGDRIRLDLVSQTPEGLQRLRDELVERLLAGLPALADSLSWQEPQKEGDRPANFRLVELVSVTPLGRDFLRVRIAGDGLDIFAGERIHFRLVLPPAGDTDPQWPSLDANGRTTWPSGDKALHRPVYTTIACDLAAGWLDFDVFVHDGGRITEWARAARPGDRIGMIGPGGAALVHAPQMLLAGDETAYPALVRLLAHVAGRAQGEVVLLSQDGSTDYPIMIPEGFELTRIGRDAGSDGFVELLKSRQMPETGAFIWIASEKAHMRALRAHFREGLGWGQDRSYIAGFWTA